MVQSCIQGAPEDRTPVGYRKFIPCAFVPVERRTDTLYPLPLRGAVCLVLFGERGTCDERSRTISTTEAKPFLKSRPHEFSSRPTRSLGLMNPGCRTLHGFCEGCGFFKNIHRTSTIRRISAHKAARSS